ncbi:MAG: hypothetical protein GX913_05620 [Clostridiales bacterium]|nr:hypothetical protein [Clostridiales bacterium]
MAEERWSDNPDIKKIDPQKLIILEEFLKQSETKSKDELIPFFIAASSKASSMGYAFSNDETELILNILKKDMTEKDKSRVDTIRRLATLMSQKKK